MVQLLHPYMAGGKTMALIIQTFVSKVISLVFFFFFNILSKFVIAFLPGSKCLLISWLPSPSAVIFGAQENKVYHCFCHRYKKEYFLEWEACLPLTLPSTYRYKIPVTNVHGSLPASCKEVVPLPPEVIMCYMKKMLSNF